ncbi:cytochrome o ubiquinol oxidase subunit IV [Halotalea alkalilenta]|uniref:Cytochrome bo(3) ubiquinol oxidase subunit 4 n=1 Tax=Halotalea alkalilenta TaxID=376489 RepID=A0A172YJK3_9GAMM|nr:cytochrome o ubiquinol oxidase subunit IV [Halotalea alkalilenta]ANF59394.1 cytochrome o ubiquinol oxidase subunit IV [Halotalea alkalilenta]
MSGQQHHDVHTGADHGTLRSYIVGLVLSVILTVIPFALVMAGGLSRGVLLAVIMVLAVVQIVIQVIYFLHMNSKSEGGWNLITLWFTILIVGILVVGSLWIMHHLNHNVMIAG